MVGLTDCDQSAVAVGQIPSRASLKLSVDALPWFLVHTRWQASGEPGLCPWCPPCCRCAMKEIFVVYVLAHLSQWAEKGRVKFPREAGKRMEVPSLSPSTLPTDFQGKGKSSGGKYWSGIHLPNVSMCLRSHCVIFSVEIQLKDLSELLPCFVPSFTCVRPFRLLNRLVREALVREVLLASLFRVGCAHVLN